VRCRVARKLCTKQAQLDAWSVRPLAAANVGVPDVQFADQFA
jgi:hypothetical protein